MSESLCKSCKYRRDPWSDKLRVDHDGCGFCLRPGPGEDEEEFAQRIRAEFVGLGWITNGVMAVNHQPITRGTDFCPEYARDRLTPPIKEG